MDVSEALALISAAADAGRLAHGYLVCGDVRGDARELVDAFLAKLFPNEADQIARRTHPDVACLEPEGKSRTIHAKSMRERIVEPMAATAFSGGWKVGVVVGADRMEEVAANVFLKTLEEPTPRTVFFLLTDNPGAVLPTVVSRTQRIDLPLPAGLLEGEAYEAVAKVFAARGLDATWRKGAAAGFLAETLAAAKEAVEDEEVPIVRKAFFKTILSFVRDWMVCGLLPQYQAFRNVEAVEEAYRRSDRYIPDETVLAAMLDRLVFPK